MSIYHLDTNVLIDLFSKKQTQDFFEKNNIVECDLATSFICITEFLVGARSPQKRLMKNWIESGELSVVFLSHLKDFQLAADIRNKTGLKLPDAIILTAAIQQKAHLLTHDSILIKHASHYVEVSDPIHS